MQGANLNNIKIRLKFLGLFVIALGLLVSWRMFDLMVLKNQHYLALAKSQQQFEKTEIAQRGEIYFHDSTADSSQVYPMAFDVKSFAVWVVPNHIQDKEQGAEKLALLLGMDRKEIFDKINNDKLYIPPLKRGLSLDDAKKVEDGKINGVFVVPEYDRYYPESTIASQILGFVNREGKGNYGFEGHYNNELSGSEGKIRGEQDTLGRVINLIEEDHPTNGNSYVLTVSRPVQYFVEKKLKEAIDKYQAESGTVVIMDVQTGGIVAMASYPTYDPNNYSDFANNQAIFINPSIANLYEPGSIFKPIVMSMGLDLGLVQPDTKGVFDSFVMVDGYKIETAERKAFGEETMTQVLENSDNVAMVWLSEKIGKENLYKYIKAYNFFDKTGIDLDTETAGYAPPLKLWKDINRSTISFGQGISVSPIEIVAAYAAIANNGKYIYPRIVDKIITPDGTEKVKNKEEGQQIVSPETAQKVREMLYSVVANGHSKKAAVPGFKMGAKTGTAQIPKEGGGYEEAENGLGIYVHSVAGIAPIDAPRYAMLVKLTKPKSALYAESTAAPLFGEISSFLLNYYYRMTPSQ